MTETWSKGKPKRYAYYHCETRGCSQKSKSTPKAKIEDGFESFLGSSQLTKHLVELTGAMFRNAWNGSLELEKAEHDKCARQAYAGNESILELMDRLVETKNQTVLKAFRY